MNREEPVDLARTVGRALRRAVSSAKRRSGLLSLVEILPYRGRGTPRELFLKGRVLEERGITRAGQHTTAYANVLNMIRRFTAVAVGGARVKASFGGLQTGAVADAEGYFDVRFKLDRPPAGPGGWLPVELS